MPEVDDGGNQSDMIHAVLPSGTGFNVHNRELAYVTERCKKYVADNKFTNISDLQDLDRLIQLETLGNRWANWISAGVDYWNDAVDTDKLQKALNDASKELRQLKKSLGVDKETREKQRGEDSIESYLANLRVRAREFGYTREKQLDKALELFNEMKSVMVLHSNCDKAEREELKVTQEHIMKWLWETVIPQFDEIDAHFRANSHRYWIRKL